MKNISGTKTEANLISAFVGESQARNKYTFYADKARKDGYNDIAEIFEETADNERAHAEIWFKYLHNHEIQNTQSNLDDGVEGEHFEWNDMYPEFAKIAKEEGFDEIAAHFEMVGKIEEQHEQRFRKLLSQVKDNLVFSSDGDCIWQCMNCGHIAVGKKAPELCPVCKKPQAYFKRKPAEQ